MATFMDWYCKQQGISELTPKDLEGPVLEIVKVFHPDVIHLQFQMEDKVGRPALSISKMKVTYYPDVGLEQLVPDQFWIEEECKYDIADMTKLNSPKRDGKLTGFEFKHDYTVIDSPRAVTFRDRYGVQMIMRFNEIHKFSDGTLQQWTSWVCYPENALQDIDLSFMNLEELSLVDGLEKGTTGSADERMEGWSVLTDPEDQAKMEMETPRSSGVNSPPNAHA
ncbi:hypothetical protein Tco_1144105 [Tanacetum coccineum]